MDALELLHVLCLYDWNHKYENILCNNSVMKRFDQILKEGILKNTINVIKIITNMMFFNKYDEENKECLLSTDLLQGIYE
mmetsp:Transcript_14764/g.12981  ORF Transcript_14764/g.12981 Transcript_14764/m.12981 type:complete len:80 (-) Transcript_14764:1045-1284(-)